MAGPDLPAAGYITNDLRTEAQVKSSLDDLIEVVRRAPGTAAPEDLTISAGVVTPTGAGSILNIETEASVSADDLDTISISSLADGAEISIANTTGNTVTVKHEAGGSGQISLQGDVDADLDPGVVIELYLDATIWREKGRSWGDDPSALRAYQGLGTAALADVGPGNGLDADTLDGVQGSGYLLAAGTAANSSLLGGLAASGFVQTATGSSQAIASILRSTGGRFQADAISAGLSAGFDYKITNVLRIADIFDDISDRWRKVFYAPDGTTPVAELRLDADDGIFQYDPDGSSTFYDVRHTGDEYHKPAKYVTVDTEQELTVDVTATPVADLAGITFPITPDGSQRFSIEACVATELQNTFLTPNQIRMRVHVGTSGDASDTAVFVGEVDATAGASTAELNMQKSPPIVVVPGASDLVTVSIARAAMGGTVTRRHVLTHDDYRRVDVESLDQGYATSFLKITALD